MFRRIAYTVPFLLLCLLSGYSICFASITDSYWEVNGQKITSNTSYPENVSVCLVATLSTNELVEFTIYEDDKYFDDEFLTLRGEDVQYIGSKAKVCGNYLRNATTEPDWGDESGHSEFFFRADTTSDSSETNEKITSTPYASYVGYYISNSSPDFSSKDEPVTFLNQNYYRTDSNVHVSMHHPASIDFDLANNSISRFQTQIKNTIKLFSSYDTAVGEFASGTSAVMAFAQGLDSYTSNEPIVSVYSISDYLIGQFFSNVNNTKGKGLILAPKRVAGACNLPLTSIIKPDEIIVVRPRSISLQKIYDGVVENIPLGLVNKDGSGASEAYVGPSGVILIPPGKQRVLSLTLPPDDRRLLLTKNGTYTFKLFYDGDEIDSAEVEVVNSVSSRPTSVDQVLSLNSTESSPNVSFTSAMSEVRWHVSDSIGRVYPASVRGENDHTLPSTFMSAEGIYTLKGFGYYNGSYTRYLVDISKCYDGYYLGNRQCGSPPPTSITVTSPNDNRSIRQAEPLIINWESQNIAANDTVKIELLDGDQTTSITSSTINDESYEWHLLPNQTTGNNFKIKISSTSDSDVFDVSDSTFSILEKEIPIPDPEGVQVTSPNGGESIVPGYTYRIIWEYQESDTNFFNVFLYKDGVVKETLQNASTSIGNKTYYDWEVPVNDNDVAAGGGYTINVSTTYDGWVDESDTSFSITEAPSVTVLSPNGGKSYTTGDSIPIEWTIENLTTSSVKITIRNDEEGLVASFTVPNTGKSSYTVPDSWASSETYTLKVQARGSGMYKDVYDYSDNDFSISPRLERIEVSGPDSIDESTSTTYSVMAHWSDDSTTNVSNNATFEIDSDHAHFGGSMLYARTIYGDIEATVEVTYSAGGVTFTDSKTINILETLESISIEGPNIANESDTSSYSLVAHYTNGSNSYVTNQAAWSVASNFASINNDGSLVTGFITQQQSATISAGFEGLSTDKTVSIKDLASISGRITKLEDGSGVSTWVEIKNTDGQITGGMTDENGYYEFVVAAPADYTILSGGGLLAYTYFGGGYFADSASIIAVDEEEDVDGINIALPVGRSVSGTLYDHHTNLTIPNEPLSCGTIVNGSTIGQLFWGTSSDENGKYTCGGFPENFPVVVEHFRRNGYATMYYGNVFRVSDTTVVNISSSNVEGIDLRLQRTGSISGTIVAEDTGLPIEGATVWAVVPDGGGNADITDANGSYSIATLSPTDHIVHVMQKDEYIATYHGDTAIEQDTELVAIKSELNTPYVNISALAGVSISGIVIDHDTNEIVTWANVRVGFSGSTDNFANSYSNELGAFEFNPPYGLVPPGPLDIWVKNGIGDWQITSTITASPGDNIKDVILKYKTSGEVKGKVKSDGTGAGISGIPVKVIDVRNAELGNYNFETLTDSEGGYNLTVPNGEYLVFAELRALDPSARITDYIYYSNAYVPAEANSVKINGSITEGIDFTIVNPSTQPGDINGDGNIDLKDLIQSLIIVSGTINQSNSIYIGGDIGGDSRIDLQEALYIQQHMSSN